MGWIKTKAYRLGIGEIDTCIKVDESAGYTGDYVTVSEKNRKDKLRIGRQNRRVYAHKPKLS